MDKHTPKKWLARKRFGSADGHFTPYVSDGDSARFLFFMNLSGAYDGYAGCEQANDDAQLICRAVNSHEALVGALEAAKSCIVRMADDDEHYQVQKNIDVVTNKIDAALKLAKDAANG